MKTILDNWKNSQDMIGVRHSRHKRLCQALSLIGSIFLLIFGFLSLSRQQYWLGGILLTSMSVALVNVYLLHLAEDIQKSVHIINAILFTLASTLLFTGGLNNTGILWIYPLFALNLFINRFWPAAYLAGGFILFSSILLLTPLSHYLQADYSNAVAIRFILTLLALYVMCLAALYSKEHAYDMLTKLHHNDVHRLAFYDSLTGLPNRWTFQNNLTGLLKESKQVHSIALLYIDLDNFKHVNDTYGHEKGDAFLLHFGNQLKELIRPNAILTKGLNNEVARLAGDEFVITLTELSAPQDAAIVANKIINMFDGGYTVEDQHYPVYVSIGVSLFPEDTKTSDELLRYADAAMYEAKHKGNNHIEFFTREIADAIQQKQNIEEGLRRALAADQFSLVYQPMFCSKTKNIAAYEVLLRCHEPQLQGFGPEIFIPIAESTGLIKALDQWIIENSFKSFIEINEATGFKGQCCINISGKELLDEQFPERVESLLTQYNMPRERVELEITETALVPDNPIVMKVLNDLAKQGLSLSLDDFGTGYTSFNQLILYPADSLKIDYSFVNDLFSPNEAHGKMVSIIHDLATIYNLTVVAEGVETQEQFDYLRDLGCNFIQGYFLSPPVDRDALITLIENNRE